jgi:hypothetical protein
MHRLGVLGLVVAALLGACTQSAPVPASPAGSASGPAPAASTPIITGTVTAGPVCPVEQNPPDPACAPRPVAGAVIIATDATGTEVCRATSGSDGTYELVLLETGTVLVTAEAVAGLMGVPAPVAVELAEPDQVVRVDLEYDTGIR